MSKSNIEWTEYTWNPTTGCNKVSAGCKNCYAELLSNRLKEAGNPKYQHGFDLTLHPNQLKIPFNLQKPTIVFVNSMSDLFHERIPLQYIQKVFEVMNQTPQHTYQILTKRPELVVKYNNQLNWTANIWMGVSVEDEKVIERIELLKNTGAQIKFLSIEPLIGPLVNLNLNGIHWAIVGGESGLKARPMQKDWVVDVREQCIAQKVKFFFKQWGKPEFNPNQNDPTIKYGHQYHAKGGCMLEGKIWRQMPIKNEQLV